MAIPGQYAQDLDDLTDTTPTVIRRAVAVMRFGAAVKVAEAMVQVFQTASGSRMVGGGLIGALVAAAVWVWIGQVCKLGHSWARVAGTVLFGLATLILFVETVVMHGGGRRGRTLAGTGSHGLVVALISLEVLNWLVALVSMILVWRKEADAHFHPQPEPVAGPSQQKWSMPGGAGYQYPAHGLGSNPGHTINDMVGMPGYGLPGRPPQNQGQYPVAPVAPPTYAPSPAEPAPPSDPWATPGT